MDFSENFEGGEKLVQKIIQLCKEQGKTIVDVERECSIGTRSIYRWDDNMPSVDKVKRVADYLNTTIDNLVEDI